MKTSQNVFPYLVFIGVLFGGFAPITQAQKWEPYQFKGNEKYEYKITLFDEDKKSEIFHILEVKKTDKKNEAGEEMFEVSYTTKGLMSKSEIGVESPFSLIGAQGYTIATLILNPVYNAFFKDVEMKVGEKITFAGIGVLKVTGKEKVANREGLKCQLSQKDEGGNEEVVVEWVIDPALALPIHSKIYQLGKVQSECVLTNFITR